MEERIPRLLSLLARGLVLARQDCRTGNIERAEAILDALHNVPEIIAGKGEYSEGDLHDLFIEPLVLKYPELSELQVTLSHQD